MACSPLLLAVTIFAMVSLFANKQFMELPEESPLMQWARLCLNAIFLAIVYLCIHVFPLSCIYTESEDTLHYRDADALE